LNKDVDQAAVLQRRLDLDREAKAKGLAETVTNVKAGMADIYRRLAPKIERHRDSFLAGQLYDELENYAELHGAEGEFKRMMSTARGRAHMEYDTNPGGFQNWFWFLPFEDEQLEEAIPTIRGIPKAQPSADYTGEDLVRDANALFTAGGFKLADKEVEPRVDNPKKINTTYYWRKKIKGLTPGQGQVQQLMIEIYNYAPNRTYWAINDWANDGARVTPDLAQKLWRRMEKTIKDSIDTAERENYWYSMTGNGKKPKDLEEEGVAEGFTDTLKSVWREIKTYVVDFVANAVGLPDDQRREVFVQAGNTFSNEVIKLLANHPARDKLIPMVREIGGYMAKARTLKELNSLMDKAELFLADVDAGKFDPPVAKTLPDFGDRQGMTENASSVSDKDITDLIHDVAVHLIFNKQRMSIDEADPKLVAIEVQKAYKMEGIPFTQSDLTRVQNIFPKVMRRLRKGFSPEVKDSEDIDEQGMAEGVDDIKKRMSKLEALALAANRAGDDAKCKMYQQKIQSLKQKLSQSMSVQENISREPRTAQERDDMIDKIRRMMALDRDPANLQIMKKDIEILQTKYRDLKEDSGSGEAVEMAIMRRMLVAHTDLIVEFGLDKVVAAIEEVAYDVGDVDEIGSSDVSGWVRQVERILGADA
jgi:hypothetical protein